MASFSAGRQLDPERLDDGLRDLVLQREDVVQVPVVALGPDVIVARCEDQLCGDPYAAARLAHAPFQHVTHVELARDLRDFDVPALVDEGAVARNDDERRDLGQVRDDVLGDAVAEIFLFRIAAHVGERQDADRSAGGLRRGRGLGRFLPRGTRITPAPARDDRFERSQDFLELRAVGAAGRLVEVRRVDGAHVDRQARPVEAHGHEDPAVRAFARLAADPSRLHRGRRPDHEDCGGTLELFGDLPIELLPRRDGRVPPDDQPFASMAATSGATRALSTRAYEMNTSAMQVSCRRMRSSRR
jgi:hypothetical protein